MKNLRGFRKNYFCFGAIVAFSTNRRINSIFAICKKQNIYSGFFMKLVLVILLLPTLILSFSKNFIKDVLCI